MEWERDRGGERERGRVVCGNLPSSAPHTLISLSRLPFPLSPLFNIPRVDNVFPGSPAASQCPWLSGDQTLRSIRPLLAALARCLSRAPSALRYVNILCDGEGEKRPRLISTSKQPEMRVIIRKSGMLIVV